MGLSRHGNVQFTPGAAFILAVYPDLPFPFAIDLQACGIYDQMLDLLGRRSQGEFECARPSGEGRIVRRRQLHFEQPEDGAHQALRGAQGQMIDLAQEQRAEDGRIRVGAAAAPAGRAVLIEPSLRRARIDSEREATARD